MFFFLSICYVCLFCGHTEIKNAVFVVVISVKIKKLIIKWYQRYRMEYVYATLIIMVEL